MRPLSVSSAFLLATSFVLSAAAGQPTRAGTLTDAVRAHLTAERFEVVSSIRGLPLGVREELQTMWKSQTLDIAEPGAEYQGTSGSRGLPSRRLIAAGCSADHHCLVYYERDGRAREWIVALFQWTPEVTQFDGGGTAPSRLKTLEDVRQTVVSGRLGPTDLW